MGYLPKHIFPFMLHQLVPKSLHTCESTRYAVKPLSLLEANTSNFITRVFNKHILSKQFSYLCQFVIFSTKAISLQLCGYLLATQVRQTVHTRWTEYAVGAASVPTYRDAVLTIFRDYESCTTVTGQKMFSKAFTESEKKA